MSKESFSAMAMSTELLRPSLQQPSNEKLNRDSMAVACSFNNELDVSNIVLSVGRFKNVHTAARLLSVRAITKFAKGLFPLNTYVTSAFSGLRTSCIIRDKIYNSSFMCI